MAVARVVRGFAAVLGAAAAPVVAAFGPVVAAFGRAGAGFGFGFVVVARGLAGADALAGVALVVDVLRAVGAIALAGAGVAAAAAVRVDVRGVRVRGAVVGFAGALRALVAARVAAAEVAAVWLTATASLTMPAIRPVSVATSADARATCPERFATAFGPLSACAAASWSSRLVSSRRASFSRRSSFLSCFARRLLIGTITSPAVSA